LAFASSSMRPWPMGSGASAVSAQIHPALAGRQRGGVAH
jgi:hypothetical protein